MHLKPGFRFRLRQFKITAVTVSLLLIALIACTAVAAVFNTNVVAQGEKSWEFEQFDSDITINEDGSFTVRETQVINFTGSFSFLNRDLVSTKATFSDGSSYGKVRYKDIQVYGLDGSPYDDWETESIDNGTRVKINFSAQDEQSGWIVEYRVTGAIIYGEDYDRFYWNAVSEARDVLVKGSRTTLQFPEGTDLEDVDVALYVDQAYGPESSDFGRDGDTLWWEVTGVQPYTTYTVDVAFPKGIVEMPWQYSSWFLYLVIAVSALMLLASLVIMLVMWWRKGRDVGRPELDVVRYLPPEDLKPAEVGMLVNEKPRTEDISATIVDLAIKGKLVIFEEGESGILKRKKYGFKKKNEDVSDLEGFESKVMEGLFETGAVVTEDGLKNKFYVYINIINRMVRKSVMKKGMFIGDPVKVRSKFMYIGLAVAIPVPILLFLLNRWYDVGHALYLSSGFIISGMVIWLVGIYMPRRSQKGSEAYSYSMGFKEYMETAEDAELEYMTPENFQRNLPYAMVLDVTDKWAEKFEGIYTTPPAWFEGSYTTFSTVYLAGSLSGMAGNMNSTLTSSPSSSGGGGFGGGSAGGGFGGGGSSAG